MAVDDFFDDFLDLSTPTGLTFAAASGMLDDEPDDDERCSCWCDCPRRIEPGALVCTRCENDRHADDDEEGAP